MRLSSADKGEVVLLQMLRPHFLVLKTPDFSEIYGVPARGGGVEPVRTRGERGSIFRDYVQTSFMDGPLTDKNFS